YAHRRAAERPRREDQKADGDYDGRKQERRKEQQLHEALSAKAEASQRDRAGGSERYGDDGRDDRNDEARGQRFLPAAIAQNLGIPFERQALRRKHEIA